jgi:pre-mRNA-processing factor 39
MVRLNSIFKRIMTYPLSNLDDFWDKYNHFVLAQQLSTLATKEEIQQISGGDDQMDEGMLRIKIVSQIEQIKNKTAQGIAKRQTFEAGIDRTYFHVTPVTEASLKNWHAYLDYEEIAGEEERCQQLYERCLISCANYQDVWVRYALWKEKNQGFEAAQAIFQRAVNIFLKYRATIYLEYAVFLEANQKIQQAREIYTKVTTKIAPTLAEAYVKFCNFERRQKDDQIVKQIYQKGINQTRENHEVEAFGLLVAQYANFVHKKLQKTQEAREIYLEALEQVSSCLVLWLSYLHFELNDTPTDNLVEKIEKIYTKALGPSSDLSNEAKNDLWYNYAEFMENYGSSINQVRAVYEKEITWKRKNQMPRIRTLHLLELNIKEENNSSQVGVKRARPDSFGSSNGTSIGPSATATATASTTASTTSTATTTAATAQYYQNYQVRNSIF